MHSPGAGGSQPSTYYQPNPELLSSMGSSGTYQHIDGLSAEQLRKSLDGIPSSLQGLRSPMSEAGRSECLAGMDMLNDMFQRQVGKTVIDLAALKDHCWLLVALKTRVVRALPQARRLESQLYQRAQDQRTIEYSQQQVQKAMAQVPHSHFTIFPFKPSARWSFAVLSAMRDRPSFLQQVRALEEHHVLQAARLSQSAKSLQILQRQMRGLSAEHERALSLAEGLLQDVFQLSNALQRERPGAIDKMQLNFRSAPPISELRSKAAELTASMQETERSALQQIGATPTTALAMSSDCNPLHDLSAVADYASPVAQCPRYAPASL